MEFEDEKMRVGDAFRAMNAANEECQRATTEPEMRAAEATFNQAKEAHAGAVKQLERVTMLESAKRALPVLPLEGDEQRAGGSSMSVTGEPLTYRKHGQHSFFRDVYGAQHGDMDAMERVQAHKVEVRAIEGERNEYRALAETAGAGGELVPPLYLNEELVPLARAGRATADAVTHLPLPPQTNSLVIPRVTTGAATAAQADLGVVANTDPATNSIQVPVITIAGNVDLARQLFDRMIPSYDEVLFRDLISDYSRQLNQQVLTGSGILPNAKGILSVTGVAASTYTSPTPSLSGLYSKLADVMGQMNAGRFLPPQAIILHPRRWAWCLAQIDTAGRPLIVPTAGGAQNVAGNLTTVAAEAVVGTMLGLPVISDPSIPTNRGAGANEDVVLMVRTEDHILWEQQEGVQTRVFEQVLSANLAIRLQVFGYAAFTAERYAKSTGVVSGTSLTPPAF